MSGPRRSTGGCDDRVRRVSGSREGEPSHSHRSRSVLANQSLGTRAARHRGDEAEATLHRWGFTWNAAGLIWLNGDERAVIKQTGERWEIDSWRYD
jgi:hypothetical protein